MDSSPGLVGALIESDDLIGPLVGVQDLGMLNAELTTLRAHFPARFPNLAVLHLTGSSWHCDTGVR